MPGITKAEAARQMGISRTTLYKLISEGKLSARPDGTIDPTELVRAVSTLAAHRERIEVNNADIAPHPELDSTSELSKAEAARQLKISSSTLYKLIQEGKLSVNTDGAIDTPELMRYKREAKPMSGYIYWIRMGVTRYVKIGKARNVEERLATLQSACPLDLKIIRIIQTTDMDQAERSEHLFYKSYRIRGEWFLFPPGTFQDDETIAYRQTRISELKRERQELRQRIQELERQVTYFVKELNKVGGF